MGDTSEPTLLHKLKTSTDDSPAATTAGGPVEALHGLAASLFAAVAAFRAAYLHLQTAHAPFDAGEIRAADRSAVAQLRLLSRLKHSHRGPLPGPRPSAALEAGVEENWSLLCALDLALDRLQSEIDISDGRAASMERRRDELEGSYRRLERRLAALDASAPEELLLSVGLFNSVVQDVCRSAHGFTKLLARAMKRSGMDLGLVANSLYPRVRYAKREHNRYALLSFVCLSMFGGFNLANFGLEGVDSTGTEIENLSFSSKRRNLLEQFVDHGSVDPLELLAENPDCDFARFCSVSYRKLMSSTMESCLFGELGEVGGEESLYEAFVSMASLIWMLHKLAFAYDPRVEIFQVERGASFSIVYMEDVCRRREVVASSPSLGFVKARREVGFTVLPGFKVGKTVIQSRVYLNDSKLELLKVANKVANKDAR